MNKQDDQESRLLAETFQTDWETGPTAGYARAAAAYARRRHRFRSALVAAGTTAGLAAVLAFALLHRPAPLRLAPAVAKAAPAYEIISDDELLAQLHDRPLLAMRQANGTRKFVLLEN